MHIPTLLPSSPAYEILDKSMERRLKEGGAAAFGPESAYKLQQLGGTRHEHTSLA